MVPTPGTKIIHPGKLASIMNKKLPLMYEFNYLVIRFLIFVNALQVLGASRIANPWRRTLREATRKIRAAAGQIRDDGRLERPHEGFVRQRGQCLSDRCQCLSGWCQCVSDRCQCVSDWCQCVSDWCQCVSDWWQSLSDWCQCLSDWWQCLSDWCQCLSDWW